MTALTKGTGLTRLLSAYVAMVLMVAVTGPGMAVYADDIGTALAGSEEASSTTLAETPVEPAPPMEPEAPLAAPAEDPAQSIEAEPVTVLTEEPAVAAPDEGAAVVAAAGGVSLAAVVPATNTNLGISPYGYNLDQGKWTGGNLGKDYTEDDWVWFRVILENKSKVDDIVIPQTSVAFSHYSSTKNAIFYDETRVWSYHIANAAPSTLDPNGAPAGVELIQLVWSEKDTPVGGAYGSAPTLRTSFADGHLIVPAGKYAVVYFQAHLAVTGDWNEFTPSRDGASAYAGSSAHVDLDMTGIGKQDIPSPSGVKPLDPPAINVTKTANPTSVPETGGNVTFTVTVENIGTVPVTLTGAVDTVFGPIAVSNFNIQTIPVGETATYSFVRFMQGEPSTAHHNVVTVTAENADGVEVSDSDDADVAYTDVMPEISVTKNADPLSRPEPGGLFTYTYVVTNEGDEEVTLTSVTDDVIGTIALPADVTLGPGESSAPMTGTWTYTDAGIYPNTVTAVASDNDGNTDTATADASVEVTDVMPLISVSKVANPLSLPEPGGLFTYTYVVTNNSVEDVTVTSVVDDILGAIPLPADVTLAPGESTVAMIASTTYIEAGTYPNIVTAKAVDNEGNEATATANASVTVTDELPDISVTKTADPLSLPEPGGEFTYTFIVTNQGVEPVTLTSVTDSVIGAITLPAVVILGPGDSSAPMTATATHTDKGVYPNTVTAIAVDNEGNSDTATADASVEVTDVMPTLEVVKSVTPLEMNMPGGSFSYSVTVTNTSVEPVKVTLVEDDVYGIVYQWMAEAPEIWLASGESSVFEFSMDHTTPGEYRNTVEATVVDNEGNPASASDDAVVNVWNPAIQVVKTSDAPNGIVAIGTLVTYTYVVTNVGDVDLFDIVVTDDKLGVVGTLEMLAVGASETFTASAVLENTTTNVVVATGEDKNGDEVSDQDALTVETFLPFTPLDLAIEKIASNATFEPGDVVTYTLRYQNLGTRPATDFTIVDDFDERYVTVLDAKGGVVANGKITWSMAGPLTSADGVQVLTYTVRVKADMPTGTTKVGNIVVITPAPDVTDDDLTNNRDEASITVKEEPFLPFTGGDATLLLMVAFLSAITGLFLRRRAA